MKLFDKDKGKQLFGKVSGAISKTVDQVVEGVDTVADSARLKLAINKTKGKLEDKKCELGGVVYQYYLENQSDDSKIVSICEEIRVIENELHRLETEGLESKEVKEAKAPVCPKCQTEHDGKTRFCPECGNQLQS